MVQESKPFGMLSVLLASTVLPTSVTAEHSQFLKTIGDNINGPAPNIVRKEVQRPKGLIGNAIGRTNWNTDFLLNQPGKLFKSSLLLILERYPRSLSNRGLSKFH